MAADNYGALTAIKGHLLYVRRGSFYYGRDAESKTELRIFSVADRKETTLADGVDGYALSADGSKVLVQQGPAFTLHDTSPKAKDGKKTVSIANLAVDRVPANEWAQIFDEVWRRYRDFFYVDNLHGYDWEALRARYRPLLRARRPPLRPQLRHRRDDRRVERRPRLQLRRRLGDPTPSQGRPARRRVRPRPGGGTLQDRQYHAEARTRSRSIVHR